MTTYPYGYGTGRCTLAELEQMFGAKMHPEYRRRLFAWLESRGGAIGIGGGWRKTPSDTSQASRDGKSFHQDQRHASGFVGCTAVDLVVGVPGAAHRAPTWAEVPKQDSGHADIARFGVHCNVSNEPWHMQWTDETIGGYACDGWGSWDAAGRPDPSSSFVIDGSTGGGGGGDDGLVPPTYEQLAAGDYWLFPIDDAKPEIKKGSTDESSACKVGYLQAVLRNECELTIEIDGIFGAKTEKAVKQMQGWNKLAQDGRCGPQTWACVDEYALASG